MLLQLPLPLPPPRMLLPEGDIVVALVDAVVPMEEMLLVLVPACVDATILQRGSEWSN